MDEMRNGTLNCEQTETSAHQRSSATSDGRTLGLNFRAALSRALNELAEPTPTMRPTPALQMPFYYGPPGQGPHFSIDMIKLMTSIIFNMECPQTILEAFAQRHWGAHASTILGVHITWNVWKQVLLPIWIINEDHCKANIHWNSREQALHRHLLVVQHLQHYLQELDGRIEQDRCATLLRAYKNNPVYNPNAHRFTLLWPNYLSGDAILGPAPQKLSPTTNETGLNAPIQFSNTDQSSKPPPLLARDDSSDDDSLFGDSDSSVHSAISIKPPPQPYPYMVDPSTTKMKSTISSIQASHP
jgi:hypothetical protein